VADRICDQLLASFDDMIFDGSENGREFFTWDGVPCRVRGYPTLSTAFHVLYAMARHKGWIKK